MGQVRRGPQKDAREGAVKMDTGERGLQAFGFRNPCSPQTTTGTKILMAMLKATLILHHSRPMAALAPGIPSLCAPVPS